MRVKEDSEKADLKHKIQKTKIMASSPIKLCVLSRFSHVRVFATPWVVARRAPLSMGFSNQEYWSGLLCPSPGDLPDPGIKPASLTSNLH